jgi:hypothetical protein
VIGTSHIRIKTLYQYSQNRHDALKEETLRSFGSYYITRAK